MKKKELTQEEMDFILGGEEIQLNRIAGATNNDNNNTIGDCKCEYNDHRSSANNNTSTTCKCTCT